MTAIIISTTWAVLILAIVIILTWLQCKEISEQKMYNKLKKELWDKYNENRQAIEKNREDLSNLSDRVGLLETKEGLY